MSTRTSSRFASCTWRPLVLAAGLLALAMGPIPGKWKVPDGGKVIRKPPKTVQVDTALIQNWGPDQVVATSKGSSQTKVLAVEPNGVSVSFTLPVGGKNVVLRDPVTNGQNATGTLIWAKTPKPPSDGGNGSGTGK